MEEVRFIVFLDTRVEDEDLPALPKSALRLIKDAIAKRLSTHPDQYGKPLMRNLKGYRRLRVSSYRIIYKIDMKKREVFIVAIDDRKDVYELCQKAES